MRFTAEIGLQVSNSVQSGHALYARLCILLKIDFNSVHLYHNLECFNHILPSFERNWVLPFETDMDECFARKTKKTKKQQNKQGNVTAQTGLQTKDTRKSDAVSAVIIRNIIALNLSILIKFIFSVSYRVQVILPCLMRKMKLTANYLYNI